MSRDFEDGPPLSRKARTMERLDQETLQELRTQYSWRKLPNGAEVQGDAPGGVVIMLLDSLEAAEAEIVTERAMHSGALQREAETIEKLEAAEAACAGSDNHVYKLACALRRAARELNAIRARDGVPYTSYGHKSDVDENYFSDVIEGAFLALEEAGYPFVPWGYKEQQPSTAGQQLLDELASLRAWRDQAVEAMESVQVKSRMAPDGEGGRVKESWLDANLDALSACLAAAKEVGGG